MPLHPTCPKDPELLGAAVGEELSEALRAHLQECARCRAQVEQYRAQMQLLREVEAEDQVAQPTVDGSAPEHGSPNGAPEQSDETASGCVGEATAEHVSAPDTDQEFSGETDEPPLPAAIGKYLVIGRFPRTGQAEVFRVVHPQLHQERVIKLAKERISVDGRSDIIDEGRILVDLNHPNMVRVHELDFHEDRPYLVMEYVRGRSLRDYAAEHPLSPRQAAALVAKVCGAAEAAHRRGIVHRDIKHLNILIDEANEPRLIDFGMARARTFWSHKTAPAGGTFAFMAPEQARIESPEEQQKVGPRSDVFALGAVLYFLLTGKAPFDGRNWHESMARAHECDFDRKALDTPKVPGDLRRICLKAMAAGPAERFASAAAFQKALRLHVARPKLLAAAGSGCALILLAVLLYAFLPSPVTALPPVSAGSSPVAPTARHASITAPPQPMKGRIDLLVVKSKDGTRRRLRLEDPRSVPIRAGDEIRVEARLDRPAYLYLFWIGADGKVAPLYPWKDHKWSARPAEEEMVKAAELPEIFDEVLEIPASTPGLETLVLLARADSPLPREDEDALAEGLSGAAASLPPGTNKAIWIEDGAEVVFEPAAGSQNARGGEEPLSRGVPSAPPRKSDDPVLRIRAILSSKLKPLGSYSQAVLFPNNGG
jgi:serine/threonine protein kinase